MERDEAWRQVGDRIFARDRQRFKKLIVWIRTAEQRHSQLIIRDALLAFEQHERICGEVENWWTYLTVLVNKTEVRSSIQAANGKHERFKEDERAWLKRMRTDPTVAIALLSAGKKLG